MIPIIQQDDLEPPYERCVFCRKPTMFWTNLKKRKPGEQVACCKACSKENKAADVLSKTDWCERERKLMRMR